MLKKLFHIVRLIVLCIFAQIITFNAVMLQKNSTPYKKALYQKYQLKAKYGLELSDLDQKIAILEEAQQQSQDAKYLERIAAKLNEYVTRKNVVLGEIKSILTDNLFDSIVIQTAEHFQYVHHTHPSVIFDMAFNLASLCGLVAFIIFIGCIMYIVDPRLRENSTTEEQAPKDKDNRTN